jgi:hypothetical protein
LTCLWCRLRICFASSKEIKNKDILQHGLLSLMEADSEAALVVILTVNIYKS